MTQRPPGWRSLAVVMVGAGALHLARPAVYEPLIPHRLGNPLAWVYASGVAEMACGAGLLAVRSRPVAALATAVLFVAVFPGNVQMAVAALRSDHAGTLTQVITLARLPLQVPLVLWALSVRRTATSTPAPRARA